MNCSLFHFTHRWLSALTFMCVGCLFVSPARAQLGDPQAAKSATSSSKSSEPTAAQLRTLVEQALKKSPHYAPGNLISRRDVEVLFSDLLQQGVTSADDHEDLAECVLSDSSFLVGRLKTPVGRAFMKKIAADPTNYDRLERLTWTADGRHLVDSFIKAKDGPAKLQQLKTAEQLAKVSKRLAADASTDDFALPTTKAHTAEELIAKLTEVLASRQSAE